ncbi:MAG: acetylglutamate kinase [Candidatus Omnitrophica bacterium]|nr:acetylglutamate kinase [Candidatus Omnitrophota bacterium]
MRERILDGASKYIKIFKGKAFVIKYGGSMLENKALSDSVLDDIVSFHNKGINAVIVHGGGARINALMAQRGKSAVFVDGLRITDEETAGIVDEALSLVNNDLVRRVTERGARARGLLSRDTGLISARKRRTAVAEDFLGDISAVNTDIIKSVLDDGAIPIISPVGIGSDKKLYNINADIAASEIASAMQSEKLILLTNVKGVMMDKDDDKSLISHIDEAHALELIGKGVISSGMIPKVKAGIKALDSGVKKVHIINGTIPHSLLLEVFTDDGIGTEIIK